MAEQNNKFKEGDRVAYPWFNDQQGRFVVITRMYNYHCDDYSLMNCRSYDEAKILADRLNEAISPITKELIEKHKSDD